MPLYSVKIAKVVLYWHCLKYISGYGIWQKTVDDWKTANWLIDPEPKVDSQLVYDWKLSNYINLNVKLRMLLQFN